MLIAAEAKNSQMSITAQLLCLHHLKCLTEGVDNSNRLKTFIDEVVIIPKFTIDGDDRVRKYILYIMFFIQFRWVFITTASVSHYCVDTNHHLDYILAAIVF